MRPVRNSGVKGADGTCYPHLLKAGDTSTGEIAERISKGSSFTQGDVKGLITALRDAIAQEMAMGMTVHLDGIGTFRPLLRLSEGAEQETIDSETRRNAASVEIGKVSFIAAPELLWETNTRADLQRAGGRESNGTPHALKQREEILGDLLAEEGSITVSRYAYETGLSLSSASRELRTIAARPDSSIVRKGSYSHAYYVARKEEE